MDRTGVEQETETIINNGTIVKGKISGNGILHIIGDVEGEISLDGSIMIGAAGTSKAQIHTSLISIEGNQKGDVIASEQIHVGATASVEGDLKAPAISMDKGSKVCGRVEII